MDKLAKILIFIILLVLVMPGCSNNLVKKEVSSVQKRAVKYPQTADKVAKAFAKAIIKGNFKEADKYTHQLKFNGTNYKAIRKELIYDIVSYGGGNSSDKLIGLSTKDSIGVRQVSLNKIEERWKIIETYVEYDDYFKGFATFIWYIESRNKEVLQRAYGLNNKDITNLLKFFKHNKPLFTYPKLESIYQKTFNHKIYKKGTSEGIIFHFIKDPKTKYWEWTLGKEFRD